MALEFFLPARRTQTLAHSRESGMQVEPVALFADVHSLLSLLHRVLCIPRADTTGVFTHCPVLALPTICPWHAAKEVFAQNKEGLKLVTLSKGVQPRAVSAAVCSASCASSSLADLVTQLAGTWGQ